MRHRSRLARTRVWLRQPTAELRALPSFALIGAQRAGTSSLFRYLCWHPELSRALRKEINYFSADYGRSWRWYRAHFPLALNSRLTFDATPQYFVHPLAPQRVKSVLPSLKLVVSLRDPVDRAISHYELMRRLGLEGLELGPALEREADRIGPDLERLYQEPGFKPTNFLRYSYLARSRYAEQLKRWKAEFPMSAFHFLCFDTFSQDPISEWDPLLEFLELDPWRPPSFENWSTQTRPDPVDARQRASIRSLLNGDPESFASLTKRSFPWATESATT